MSLPVSFANVLVVLRGQPPSRTWSVPAWSGDSSPVGSPLSPRGLEGGRSGGDHLVTSYGFKLFKLSLVKRDGRTAQPWELKVEGADGAPASKEFYLDRVQDLLSDHLHHPERGLPAGPDARPLSESERKQRPVFQVEEVTRRGQNALFVNLRYGRHKDEDLGLPATERVTGEVDLTEIAPTRAYRVGIFAPSSGNTGMMVVESISGACPSRYFIKWFRRWMLDASTDKDGKVAEEWYKLAAYPTTDPELLKNYVRQASADKVVLVQRASGASRRRSDERFRIEAAVFGNHRDAVMELVTQAITSETGEEESDSQYADELADVLGTDLSELELDDGWVVIETASGKQSISPTRVPEIFVYPIDNAQPTDGLFRAETKREILRLHKSLGATIDLAGW